MTGSDVVFDSWAWWEILFGTPAGARLAKRYVQGADVRVHTSALAIGELVAKLHEIGQAQRRAAVVATIHDFSDVRPVTAEIAETAGALRAELRRAAGHASLADAVMLATARSLGAALISNDPAFKGQPDVRTT